MKRVLFTLFILCFFLGKSFGQAQANYVFNVACKGDSTTLISTSTCTPPDSITTYSWDLNGDFVFGDAYGPVTTHFWGTPGNYDVGLKIYTKLGLMESIYRQVPISDVIADFSAEKFCLGDVTKFYNQSTLINCTVEKFEWAFGTGYLSNDENPTYNYLTPGSYNVSLTVYTVNGCSDTKSTIINIFEIPEISLTYSMEPKEIVSGVPVFEFFRGQTLNVTVNINNQWSDIIWSNNSHEQSIAVTESGYYTVEVINSNGCTSSLGFNVTVKEDTDIIPLTLITPNEDGINDIFLVKRYRAPGDQFELQVYNRYGDEVYSNSNYMNDWKGTYEGNTLPDGSYYYYVKYKKDGKIYKGAVNILTDK
jgi:gliding motility-associated-like protein